MFNFFGSLKTVQVSSNRTISVWTTLLNVSMPIPHISNQGVNDKIKKILSNIQMEKWLSTYCLQSTLWLCPKIARNCSAHPSHCKVWKTQCLLKSKLRTRMNNLQLHWSCSLTNLHLACRLHCPGNDFLFRNFPKSMLCYVTWQHSISTRANGQNPHDTRWVYFSCLPIYCHIVKI